jgi:NitT/TauT family transport system substrate-binding protein
VTRLAAACALLSLLAAACREGEIAASAPGAGPAAPPLRTIRILARQHLSMAPLLIADEEGYFRAQGLAIDLFALARSRDGLPALIKGDLDVLTSSVGPYYLGAIAQGARLRIVADKGQLAPDGCTYLAFLTRPELLRGGELRLPRSQERWRFSIRRGSFYDFLGERALAQAGIDSREIEVHHLSGETEIQALLQGRIDVTTNTGSPMKKAVASGYAAIWRPAQAVLPGAQFAVLLFGPSLLDEDPEAGERFMTAYLAGVRQYNRGKTERNLAILEKRTGLDRRELRDACWISMRDDGRIHAASVLELQAWAVAKGLLDRELPLVELWEPRFVEGAARRLAAR